MNGHKWTPSHTETLIRMNAVGCTDRDIAKAMGRTVQVIQRRRTDLGLPPSHEVRYGTWGELPHCAAKRIETLCGRLAA